MQASIQAEMQELCVQHVFLVCSQNLPPKHVLIVLQIGSPMKDLKMNAKSVTSYLFHP